jgi:hypothetical protein
MSSMADRKPKRARRTFTEEFKAGAVRLVLDEGKSVGAAARDLDLTESSLRNWVERALLAMAATLHPECGICIALFFTFGVANNNCLREDGGIRVKFASKLAARRLILEQTGLLKDHLEESMSAFARALRQDLGQDEADAGA